MGIFRGVMRRSTWPNAMLRLSNEVLIHRFSKSIGFSSFIERATNNNMASNWTWIAIRQWLHSESFFFRLVPHTPLMMEKESSGLLRCKNQNMLRRREKFYLWQCRGGDNLFCCSSTFLFSWTIFCKYTDFSVARVLEEENLMYKLI